ncbi:MAG: divalent-cation tolerance protein CutA [Sphingomicrobium sp.]
MSVVTVTAIFATEDEARTIGRIVVEERFAACVNIGGAVHSIYHWQSDIAEASEVAASFKTTTAMVDALIARIAELHSYDVPCIYAAPVLQLLAAYGDWVEENVRR